MQLVIAEKPSVARDLARVLGVRAKGRNGWEGEGRVITWCIGHLVELEEPAAYDARWKAWRLDTLPMIPTAFRLRAVTSTRDQLRAVRELLRDRRFAEVVNACDAGREGELIFRYVYELAGSRLAVRRLWISSLTDEAIRQGFAGLRPAAQYDGLGDAARCRSEADWLVGMNATRAVTIRFRQAGAAREARPPVYSIGRVQTPTLAIIVRREQAIRSFRPTDYWEVRGTFAAQAPASEAPESFTASWTARPDPEKRAFTRLGRRELAETVVARSGAHGAATDPAGPIVERLVQKRTREPPPLLFDLTSLQRTANRRFGLSASRTLEAAQALYERHKVLTYPRTDSRHLPDDLAGEVPKLFAGLAKLPVYAPFVQPLLGGAPPVPGRARRIFDPAKVQDHHAIIPTGRVPGAGALSQEEARVFDLVVRRFLGAFHPDAEFASTEAVIRVGPAAATMTMTAEVATPLAGTPPASDAGAPEEATLATLPPPPDRFVARGRVCLVAGWRTVAGLDEGPGAGDNDKGKGKSKGRDRDGDREVDLEARLPLLAQGQRLDGRFETLARQTRPPPRHSEATLLAAMEFAGREIEDEALRAAMKDTGLGTPATRAATIETLLKRQFITREGKVLIPTDTGIALIERLPVPTLASPELTGAWEERLAKIARRQDTRAAFMADIVRYVREVTDAIRGVARAGAAAPSVNGGVVARKVAAPAGAASAAAAPAAALPELQCPRCRQGKLLAGKRGWGCSRWREGCAFVIWFEIAGKSLSAAQLRDLVEKGKTRKGKWPQPGGSPVAGHLVLDLVAAREHGAARFVPG